MFICKSCSPEHAKWLFDLVMGISYGPCEICHITTECVDWHGNFSSEDTKLSVGDVDKYGEIKEVKV